MLEAGSVQARLQDVVAGCRLFFQTAGHCYRLQEVFSQLEAAGSHSTELGKLLLSPAHLCPVLGVHPMGTGCRNKQNALGLEAGDIPWRTMVMGTDFPSMQSTEFCVFPKIWVLMQTGATDAASTPPLPPPPEGKFLWKRGERGKSSHVPAARPARGCRAAFLPLSHTSLHLCDSLGDVRSFFQLLQVSIKRAADSSMEMEQQ